MSLTQAADDLGAARSWGWVAHLSAGGTTPWTRWRAPGAVGGDLVPGAQQLELLRRLNLAGRPSPALVRRVLAAQPHDRGRGDLDLVGLRPPGGYGAPPVDPAALGDPELLRVACAVLAAEVVAAGQRPTPAPHAPASAGRTLPRPWRVRYRIVGDPRLADPVRRDLIARGRPPGGRRPVVLVMGTELGQMVADAYAARVLEPGAPRWRRWVDDWVQRDVLPPRADLAGIAERWARRHGSSRIRVVLDPGRLPRLLRVGRVAAPEPPPAADALELVRRTAVGVGLSVPGRQQPALLRAVLVPRVLAACPSGPVLAVPRAHRAWLRRGADRTRAAFDRAGYAVCGDLDRLSGPAPDADAEADAAGTLRVAVRVLLDGTEPR